MGDGLQKGRARDIGQPVPQTDGLVDFFTGLFEVMGITIEETGEKLTVRVGEAVHRSPPHWTESRASTSRFVLDLYPGRRPCPF